MHQLITELGKMLEGEFFTDFTSRILYATDASVYKEYPLAVALPKNKEDIRKIIEFARQNKIPIIPRTAGTSLAGQVVGSGIVVDISKYLNKIIEINTEEHFVRLEPGVVLDELNKKLASYGLFFGPETSTSNRCMIGGMIGNNSCGSHSIIYGSTRDHTISVKGFLSDGSEVEFKPLTKEEFLKKCNGNSLENKIYQFINNSLSNPEVQNEIRKEFPDPELRRRNTGYAIDILLESEAFTSNGKPINISNLIAGSEGTLLFITEVKLNLVSLPPKEVAVVAVHCKTIQEALRANLVALKFKPVAVELMDNIIIKCTAGNSEQSKNRFFIEGNPAAVLMVEFTSETKNEIIEKARNMQIAMENAGYGYHFPIIYGNETKKVWNLRKAGLGLLSNIPGDAKSVAVIEDTAVNVEVLPQYAEEFDDLMKKLNLSCVYYAHVGSGELHLKPVLNLKNANDVELFHTVAFEVAKLVKRFNGSLSGEHGDGRLRGEFIPLMIGEKNYELLKALKNVFDPEHIFNPGKITDTPSMTSNIRYKIGENEREIATYFDFSDVHGIIKASEKCNGSADCRKSSVIGGTMCPSFMATKDEKNTTRARANILQEFLNNQNEENPFNHNEIYEVMDLCLLCKACKTECPSSVDVAKLKMEFLQHYYEANGIPLRSRLIAYLPRINAFGSVSPGITNFILNSKFTANSIKKFLEIETKRNFPLLSKISLRKWFSKIFKSLISNNYKKSVYLFIDEFTNYNDTEIGQKAIILLSKLGYNVLVIKHKESGRTFLSKGLLRTARKIAIENVSTFSACVTSETPLIGIEPSAILTFRDEYSELVPNFMKNQAKELASNTFMIEEFLSLEMKIGNILKSSFHSENKQIKLHGHCQQKAIASTNSTKEILSFPEKYSVEEIPSGCCGMAGSFGYEKEHFELSMKIGELVLFPEVRKTADNVIVAASGTSCRNHINDATGKTVFHPVEILFDALT